MTERVPTPARLLVAGDTHGNARWIGSLAEWAYALRCDGIVQLSVVLVVAVDAPHAHFGLTLWWVDGNHENHAELRDLDRTADRDEWGAVVTSERTRWLPRGLRWSWAGVAFGALGGAFSIDWRWRTPGQSWWPEEVTTDADVERLGNDPLDVLLCHEAPAGFPAHHPFRADPADEARSYAVRQHLAEAVHATRPRLVLHGHWHRRHSTRLLLPGEHTVQVEGLASDNEGDHRSWGVLELPALRFTDGTKSAPPGHSGRETGDARADQKGV